MLEGLDEDVWRVPRFQGREPLGDAHIRWQGGRHLGNERRLVDDQLHSALPGGQAFGKPQAHARVAIVVHHMADDEHGEGARQPTLAAHPHGTRAA